MQSTPGFHQCVEPLDAHGEQLEIVHCQIAHAIGECRHQPRDGGSHPPDARGPHLLCRALGNDVGALPVVAAVEHHQDAARIEATQHLLGIARLVAQPEPQHVHRRAEVADLDAGLVPHRRMPSIGADDEIGADVDFGTVDRRLHTDDPAALLDQPLRLGMHQEPEAGIALAAGREEIEEVPLRHHRNEPAAHRQMGHVGDRDGRVAELAREVREPVMRQLQKVVEQAKLVHHVQGGGVNRVAAKIAQKVAMLFQDDNAHAGARQQEAQHHTRRAAAGDATLRLHPCTSRDRRWLCNARGRWAFPAVSGPDDRIALLVELDEFDDSRRHDLGAGK